LTVLHVIVPFMPIVPEQYVNTATWEQIDNPGEAVDSAATPEFEPSRLAAVRSMSW
jgi:hypothetical protein